MSVPRARMLGAVLTTGLALGMSGCSGDSSQSDKATSSPPTAASSTPPGTPAQESPGATSSASPGAGTVEGKPAGGEPLVPGREFSARGARWRVEVVSAVRRADFLVVGSRVTLLTTKPGDEWVMAYNVWADGTVTSAEKFEVLDLIGKKRYLVARDSADKCVCSRDVNGIQLYPGQSTILEATFAAPPSGVSKVEVVGPAPIGTFSDVPLS